ncbi:MAG: sortase [Eubacterium sp.]|nr:sortase [Eubacterium sp.]
MMHRKRKLGLLMMISGAVLLIAALSLLVYNYFDNKRAGEEAETVLTELHSIIDANKIEEEEAYSPVYIYPKDEEVPSVELDGNYYIGIVAIPSLGLELPVMKEWSYANLRITPCCYSGSVASNDLVIAGHNYNTHFGRLKYLREGEQVMFTDINGNVFKYETDFTETLEPTAIEAMTSGDYPLTLFTCTYSGQARTALRCIR